VNDIQHDPSGDEVEYVGSPTAFADAQEMPEWVAMFARVLFFVPAAFITATTIPIILLGMLLVCGVMMACLVSVVI
jgi:hypothetical protein